MSELRPVISVAAAAEILDASPRTIHAYLRNTQMPRLEGYRQLTAGSAKRVHALKVYADSVTSLQRWFAAQEPLSLARAGLPAELAS